MSLRTLQKRIELHYEKGFDHCRNSRSRGGMRESFSGKVNGFKMAVTIPASTATRTTAASPLMLIESRSLSILMPATPISNGSRATFLNVAPFCRVFLKKPHCHAQYPFVQYHHRKSLPSKRVNNLKRLAPTPQKKCVHPPGSVLNWVLQQLPAHEQKCRELNLNLSLWETNSQNTRSGGGLDGSSGTYNTPPGTSFKSERSALPQLTNSGSTRQYPSSAEVSSVEEIYFDGKAELA